MSLINDALKKAQRQRTEGNPAPAEVSAPGTTPEQLHRVARREKPAGFRAQLLLIAGGAIATVLVLGLGAMYFFRSNQPAAVPASPAPVATAPTTAAVQTPQPKVATPAAAPATLSVSSPQTTNPVPTGTPAPAAQFPVATAPAPSTPAVSTPVQFALPAAPAVETTPVTAAATGASSPGSADRPKPSTRMIGVIEHFRVGGIRMAGTDSKVLMNDKVYRLNDTVDYELNIRLTGIEPKALTFEDSHGAIYVRTF